MRLCCCFPSAAQQATTTRGKSRSCCSASPATFISSYTLLYAENQTFRVAEQDGGSSNSMQHSAKACSHSIGAPLSTSDSNPYPAPTEHRLSWSHAPHPPSVASSTLFDPEGDELLLLRSALLLWRPTQTQTTKAGSSGSQRFCVVHKHCVCLCGDQVTRCTCAVTRNVGGGTCCLQTAWLFVPVGKHKALHAKHQLVHLSTALQVKPLQSTTTHC